MDRDETGGAAGRDVGYAGSGWAKVPQAARALGKTDRTIRRWVEAGRLEGRKVQRGQSGAIEISIDSITRMRDELVTRGELSEAPDTEAGERELEEDRSGGSVDRAIERLFVRVEETASENGRLKTRLEITERAESSRRDEADELRRRAHEAEEERARTREELAAARAELEVLKVERERIDRERVDRERQQRKRQEPESRSFWSRLFGGG